MTVMAFNQHNIIVKANQGQLVGTLLIPIYPCNNALTIIIAGSGPTDRNGNQRGLINDNLRKLAEALSENGITTFRFDKRCIGESHFPSFSESELVIEHYVADIVLLATALKDSHKFESINLIGHSEGGYHRIMYSAQNGGN